MITCQDILELQLDGVELIAGEKGLTRPVTWTYMVQTRPFEEHMNQGNFALCVADYVRFDLEEAGKAMEELYGLGISGFGISITDDKEPVPKEMIDKANELKLPLFYIRWEGASFVDIAQSVGKIILEYEMQNKRMGDYLYNLLFGYDINDRYIEKISQQFGINFTTPCRVGIIVADRKYGINLEQDEHIYEYYANYLNQEVMAMEGKPMFLRFLNKFVLLFEAKKDKSIEHELEKVLQKIDSANFGPGGDDDEQYRNDFFDGKTAMLFNGVWDAGGSVDCAAGAENIKPANFPTNESGKRASLMSGGTGFVVSNSLTDAQTAACIEFIKYMTSEEIANKIIAFGIGMAPNTNVDYTTLMDSVDAPEAKLLVSACQLCMAADYQALGLGNEFGDFEGEIQSKYAGLKDGSKTVDDVVKELDAVIAAN